MRHLAGHERRGRRRALRHPARRAQRRERPETPIRDIVANTEIFRRVLDRNQLGGKCGRCRYKFTCGGCRAMALFASGDYMGEDPQCFFEPVDETTVCEHEAETGRVFERYALMARYAGGGI
ncbi:MAG: hypothetical protein M5U12_00250 [Verrucomicrobia bacterium]|nr:hypothetical protein [Verrucomicrobiota bacterium]